MSKPAEPACVKCEAPTEYAVPLPFYIMARYPLAYFPLAWIAGGPKGPPEVFYPLCLNCWGDEDHCEACNLAALAIARAGGQS
jgi:hypothetical protein